MIERRIKELSIALEALSRINHPDAGQLFNEVRDLLSDCLREAVPPRTLGEKASAHPVDEIPF